MDPRIPVRGIALRRKKRKDRLLPAAGGGPFSVMRSELRGLVTVIHTRVQRFIRVCFDLFLSVRLLFFALS